jgi:uncharacterized protein YwqG
MSKPESSDDVRKLLISRNIPPDLAAAWAAMLRPHVSLQAGEDIHDDVTEPMSSKFGGLPDLPVGEPWPIRLPYQYPKTRCLPVSVNYEEEAPLTFLAQINLAEVGKYPLDLGLPSEGLLQFFYDAQIQPRGSDPCDVPGRRIIYVPAGTPTMRARHPYGKPLMTRSITMSAGVSLPSWLALKQAVESVSDYDEDFFKNAYWDFWEDEFEFQNPGGSQIGGYPSEIQNDDMQQECQLVTNGLVWGDPTDCNSPLAAQLAPGKIDWKLLLQLAEEFLGDNIMWGDSGRVYFWSRHQDIAVRRFDKAWTILEHY